MSGIETGLVLGGTAVTVGDVFTVVSFASSAFGSLKQGNASNAAAQYNAQVANNNAILARQTAAVNAEREKRLGRKRLGLLRANIGASGIDLAGTPLDLLSDSAAEEELNRLTVSHQGEIQSIGFKNTANLERARGKAAQSAGRMKAGSALLLGGVKTFGDRSGGGGGGGRFSSTTRSDNLFSNIG